jgi:hypothetical protein
MPKNLQEQIRERAAERDEEGRPGNANKSLEEMHYAGRHAPLTKAQKGRHSVVAKATEAATFAAGAGRAEGGRWFADALAENAQGTPLRKSAGDPSSPAAQILVNLQRLLVVFQTEEGRDPTVDDREFWRAFAGVVKGGFSS